MRIKSLYDLVVLFPPKKKSSVVEFIEEEQWNFYDHSHINVHVKL